MTPRRPRRPRHQHRAALLALTLSGALLVGCGQAEIEEPESYLLTDLEGGTASPDAAGVPTSSADTPELPEEPEEPVPTAEELVASVGAAASEVDSVTVAIGSGPSTDVEAGVSYGDVTDFAATVAVGPDDPDTLISRVDGVLYVGSDDVTPAPVDPATLAPGSGGALPGFLAWNPLLDLRAVLEGARDIAAGSPQEIDGAPVTTYTFTVELDVLPRPSLVVADDVAGPAAVTLSLDGEDLPVRLELSYDGPAGPSTRVLDYSAWGGPIDVQVPELG